MAGGVWLVPARSVVGAFSPMAFNSTNPLGRPTVEFGKARPNMNPTVRALDPPSVHWLISERRFAFVAHACAGWLLAVPEHVMYNDVAHFPTSPAR